MKPIHAVCLSGFLLTAVALYILNLLAVIPAWAVFITWASFFHMDGAQHKNETFFAILRHIGLGASAAWVSALLLLNNPLDHAALAAWWGPVLIAAVIALLMRLGTLKHFAVTPAIIYGYAMLWAFLSQAGTFTEAALLSWSFQNGLLVLLVSLLIGASAAYLNVALVEVLCRLRFGQKRAS